MAIALVQQKNGDSNYPSSPISITMDTPITSGSLLTCVVGHGAAAILSVTGGGVPTWTLTNDATQSVFGIEIWAGVVTGASAAIVVTTGSTSATKCTVAEWSGSPTLTGPTTTNQAANNTTVSTGSITPTAGRECVIIAGVKSQSNLTAADPSGYTPFTGRTYSAAGQHAAAYRIESSPSGAYSAVWTGAAFSNWAAAIAAYEVAASQVPPISRGLHL